MMTTEYEITDVDPRDKTPSKPKRPTKKKAGGDCPSAPCSACGGSGMGKPMYRPEIDKTQRDRCYTCKGTGTSAPRSPAVEWQAANLHPCDGSGSTTKAWQLRVNGRVILNAVAMSDLHEAVSPEDRRMIGVALAQYLPNAIGEPAAGAPTH
jgi:hypothetical protein